MKLLKKVIRKINLLYAQINDIDMEMRGQKQTMGQKKRQLLAANERLTEEIGELVSRVNRAKLYHAFTESEIRNVRAEEFLAANPVPYNFSSVIKDYKLMEVLQ